MNRAEYPQQHEDHPNKRERTRERIPALYGSHKHTHRNGECPR